MRLTVIGCSGSYPGPDSPASCYLVEAESGGTTTRILLDLGSGALGPLHSYADPLSIDAVFITHLHPDHCFDLSGYYVLRRYHPGGPSGQVPVYGPRGTAKRMAKAYGLSSKPGMREQFGFHVLAEHSPVAIGPLTIDVAPMVHPVDAFAIRVRHGDTALVYSGDTGPCGALVELARGADLLLAEASFREGRNNPPDLHMTGRQAGMVGAAAGVPRLVLTHIPPWFDKELARAEARVVFTGQLDVARAGATYDVEPSVAVAAR